ncbi:MULTISPECIES: ABC transporter ATP-binding protein [unclassified Microbacterium]|uniref:dipeptide ABC transporter ATP-binding protein n=1 Tax=unclassified Microbacterium TaxID=2609290 RepID=UPI000DE3DE79|nr:MULTISPECIES: ABC transporter ATP-binding protein [unclassified Microbacterium]NYF29081.1 peptide/nickel transport system ATP-binding protein [Microbacterium sp. JAI119]RBO73385.1 ABC transporter ATP-binding protein [Microbacterium sp. H6]
MTVVDSHPLVSTVDEEANETAIVSVRDLRVRFPGAVAPAVDGVSFAVTAGRCVALVGESGSGKSVTARSLLGLSGRGAQITSTELRYGAIDLRGLRGRGWCAVRGSGIGLVHQDALVSLDPLRRVGAEVAEGLDGIGSRRARAANVEELLGRVGVPEPRMRAQQRPHELSGGLRQRALIASAIAGGPRVLIADEPTTALDVTVQAQIIDLLIELKTTGTGILLVSHDLAVVSRIADEILVMNQGVVVERGAPRTIFADPQHPYTRRLIDAIPAEHRRGTRLSTAPLPVLQERRSSEATLQSATPVIEARGLHKTYRAPGGVLTALDDVSFALRRGTTLGVVGESGSGKSTAAQIVLGTLAPDRGEVVFDAKPWSGIPERERRSRRPRIQSISQDPLSSFDPRYDVAALLGEAIAAGAVPRERRRERAEELLTQVGLTGAVLARRPLDLSGGQRQRVAIAKALATNPDVLVCDEPVSALDVSVQAQVLDLLQALQEQLGVSLLFISHDLGVVRHLAHDIVVMRHGRVVESGPADDIFAAPAQPYTRELLAAVPRLLP